MALLELLNNDPKFFYYSGQGNFSQKSIPFGNDRPGGGNSQQPFIQFPLPENASPLTLTYYDKLRTGSDYPIRGGAGSNISVIGITVPEAALIDKQRIEKFLKTSKGNIFLQKQKYLQFANPKTEVGQAAQPFNQQVGTQLQGGIEYTRVYNQGRNTLAQVGVMGSGIHYDRPGLVPFNPFQLKYEYVVKNKDVSLNRLLALYKTKLQQDPNMDYRILYDLGISPTPSILLEYQGGPDSIGGVGATTIPRFSDTEFDPNNQNNKGVYAFNYNQLSDNLPQEDKGQGVIKQDFRTRFLGNVASSDYINNSVSERFLAGNPGSKEIPRVNYSNVSIVGQDGINVKNAVLTLSNQDPWSDLGAEDTDLIKFGFEAVNYSDPSTSIFLQFRAFLDSFSDNHQAAYNSVKYIGRGETFYTYDGFTRQINFGFLIAAQTRQELLPLYDKLNILASQIYPDYGANSFMRAPVVKMTIGDYIYRQPGFINSINLSIDNNYPWEIQLDKYGRDKDVAQLPQVIKAECQFTPIHDFLPRRTESITNITGLINRERYRPSSGVALLNLPNLPTFDGQAQPTRLDTLETSLVNNNNRISDTRNSQPGQFETRLRLPR